MLERFFFFQKEQFAKKVFAQALAQSEDIWGEYFSLKSLVFFPCTAIFYKDKIGTSEHEHKLHSSEYPVAYLNNIIYIDISKVLELFPKELKVNRENMTLFMSIVVFHEYAHHIQSLLRLFRVKYGSVQEMLSRRLQEAQADYFTGVCLRKLVHKLSKNDFEKAVKIVESLGHKLEGGFTENGHADMATRRRCFEVGFNGGSFEQGMDEDFLMKLIYQKA